MAFAMDPALPMSSAIASVSQFMCSASRPSRNRRIALPTRSSPWASTVTSHSVSMPMERLLMLADPMRSHSSSTIVTFEWMSRQVPSHSPGTSG